MPMARVALVGLLLLGIAGCGAINEPTLRSLPTGGTIPGSTGGTPAALQFRIQPTQLKASVPASPAPQIQIVDASGNVVTTASNTVTLSSGSASNPLLGQTTVTANHGIAIFSNVFPQMCCGTMSLTATANGLTTAATASINIIQ
jgi:hypothetical protein